MKCFQHDAEAVAVCPHCGRGQCSPCAAKAAAAQAGSAIARLTCSNECAQALARTENALAMLVQQSRQSARATSIYYYLAGLLSAGAAIAAHRVLGIPFLVWFLGGSAAALFITGAWFGRAARKTKV